MSSGYTDPLLIRPHPRIAEDVREFLVDINGECNVYGKRNIRAECESSSFAVRHSNSRLCFRHQAHKASETGNQGVTNGERVKRTRQYQKACLEALEETPEVGCLKNSDEGKIFTKEICEDGIGLPKVLYFITVAESVKTRRP
jgi:hypothetical protein